MLSRLYRCLSFGALPAGCKGVGLSSGFCPTASWVLSVWAHLGWEICWFLARWYYLGFSFVDALQESRIAVTAAIHDNLTNSDEKLSSLIAVQCIG